MLAESKIVSLPLLLHLHQNGHFSVTKNKMISAPDRTWLRITLQSVIDSTRMKNALSSALLCVKKSSNKIVKHSETKHGSGKVENNNAECFRVIFLVDNSFAPF